LKLAKALIGLSFTVRIINLQLRILVWDWSQKNRLDGLEKQQGPTAELEDITPSGEEGFIKHLYLPRSLVKKVTRISSVDCKNTTKQPSPIMKILCIIQIICKHDSQARK
jgi:hypothetical protein